MIGDAEAEGFLVIVMRSFNARRLRAMVMHYG
ncbi:hypothetical protein CULC22_01423 [Corynebacterium ulcerans BR-AD22]|nr:hypothetical protein CULC809_01409 [Corynebacterium ulcerans 809]AEG84133.1 hypothetical protein CULC22_01423 [Corynebacterium ulcerans BR-AD22]